MASQPFTITIDDAQVQAALTDLIRRVTNPGPALADIGRALGNLTEDAFQAEASPFGPAWPDLSDVTKKRRAAIGKWPGPMLQMTAGGLAASITHGADATSAWVGASKVYAAVHQFGQPKGASGRTRRGAPIPWGDIPARPFLPVDRAGTLAPAAQTEILAILTEYLRAN
jgi:phage virion morphogenesis protein